MTDPLAALRSVEAFEDLDADARGALYARVAAALGSDFRPMSDGVVHGPSTTTFAVIPGGTFVMGLTDDDIARASRSVPWDDDWAYSLSIEGQSAVPPTEVCVAPFLLERGPGVGATPRAEALERAAGLGFRLPSEAELEWVIRDGGQEALHLGARSLGDGRFEFRPSRFALDGLFIAHWAQDDWFPSHAGAPRDGSPRRGGDPRGVCRITFPLPAFCCDEDVTALFAALRSPGTDAMPAVGRLALSL
ncbi:MAG: hypothetical protein H6806_13775 [Planctomycetes bacterium]|nr:hypothetical protein [Planctomycetota bacterium]